MVDFELLILSIKKVLPDAQVKIEDLNGGGNHLHVDVVSSAFVGLSRVQQHQMIYKALDQELASEAIHALALKTSTP